MKVRLFKFLTILFIAVALFSMGTCQEKWTKKVFISIKYFQK